MAKCSFCGKALTKGEGTLYVKKDGSASFFCSGKCQKNSLKLKRSPYATRWTETYQDAKKSGKRGKVAKKKKAKKGRKKKKKR
tara:strand:- start:414 stop:662 length:249 start_codon:yes stop_codon:yes gene_type:complete